MSVSPARAKLNAPKYLRYATESPVRPLLSLVSAFAGMVLVTPNLAAHSGQITLAYDAPWECPNREQFWRQLWARSTRLSQLNLSERGLAVDARITGTDSRYIGNLRLVDSAGAVVEREVAGPNCVDVSAALALITAVTLDVSLAKPQTDLPVPARQKKSPKRIAIGPVAGIHTAVAPGVVPTLGLSATFHDRARFGSPELRIEGLFALSPRRPVTDGNLGIGDARFLWMASRVTACPFQVEMASITIGPCALVEIGALRGEGTTAGVARSDTGWWFAPGALLNWSVQTEPVWLRLAAGAVRPFVRDSFLFFPNPEVFQPPRVGMTAEFELDWAF